VLEWRVVPTVILGAAIQGLTSNDGAVFDSSIGQFRWSSPPDTIAAASKTRIVEAVNSAVRITDRSNLSTNSQLTFPSFFGAVAYPSNFYTDPRVTFDETSGHFVITELEIDGAEPNRTSVLHYAISSDDQPNSLSADFVTYSLPVTQQSLGHFNWADFDNLGYNADAYIVTLSMVTQLGNLDHARVLAISKTNPSPSNINISDLASSYGVVLTPSRMHGSVAGDPMWFVSSPDVRSINVIREDNVLGQNPTFSPPSASGLQIASSFNLPTDGIRYTVQQPGSSYLDISDSRFDASAATTSINQPGSPAWQLVAAHTVSHGSGTIVQTTVQWFEITVGGDPGQQGIAQQGEAIPAVAGSSTFAPAIDMTGNGNAVLGYLETGPFEYMASYVAGGDFKSGLSVGLQVQMGFLPYTDNGEPGTPYLHRTGDFSSVAQDPSDNRTVVVANEYAASSTQTSSVASWATVVNYAAGVANSAVVKQMYLDLLGRPADTGGLGYYVGLLSQGYSAQFVAQLITTTVEFRKDVVDRTFRTYLGRPADPGALGYYGGLLAQGYTIEQLKIALTSSTEYFNRAGATNPQFVAKLYSDILHRDASADTSGSGFWVSYLNGGGSGTIVAQGLVTSLEAYKRVIDDSASSLITIIDGLYQKYLRRNADVAGEVYYVNALVNNQITDFGIIQTLLGSNEYRTYVLLNPPP
jgi:hypothetical protein